MDIPEPTLKRGGPRPGAGRPKGRLNDRTIMAREFALTIVQSEDYKKYIIDGVKQRTLHPSIVVMLNHYAYGKPPDKIVIDDVRDQVENLSQLEIHDRAAELAREALELQAAIRIGARNAAQEDSSANETSEDEFVH